MREWESSKKKRRKSSKSMTLSTKKRSKYHLLSKVTPPTPDDIREGRGRYQLTQPQAAELVFVSTRAWQSWEQASSTATARKMPEGLWLLFNLKAMAMKSEEVNRAWKAKKRELRQ